MGILLKRLKNSKSEAVSNAAIAVVKKWKHIALSVKNKNKKKEAKESKEEPKEESKVDSDEIPEKYLIQEENAKKRNNIRKNIFKGLLQVRGEAFTSEQIADKSVDIEEKLFNKYNKRKPTEYTNRALEIIHHIKDKENQELRLKIMADNITSEDLLTIDVKKLANKKVADENEKIMNEAFTEMQGDYNMKHKKLTEGLYTCRKCHGKYTYQYEMQTRSADEPMTLFVTCATCGNSWKS